MSVDPARCANCGADVRAQFAEGIERCTECGFNLPLPLVNDEALLVRRRWHFCSWLCFLLTPVAVWLLSLYPNWFNNVVPGSAAQFLQMMAPFVPVGAFGLGTLTAGYCLAKLHANPQTTGEVIKATIAFAFGLSMVYVTVVFAGCLVIGLVLLILNSIHPG